RRAVFAGDAEDVVPHRHQVAGPEISQRGFAFPMALAPDLREDIVAKSVPFRFGHEIVDRVAIQALSRLQPGYSAPRLIDEFNLAFGGSNADKIGAVFDQ